MSAFKDISIELPPEMRNWPLLKIVDFTLVCLKRDGALAKEHVCDIKVAAMAAYIAVHFAPYILSQELKPEDIRAVMSSKALICACGFYALQQREVLNSFLDMCMLKYLEEQSTTNKITTLTE